MLKEAFERHDLSEQVEEIKQEHQLQQAIRQELDKITKELNGQEPIAEYLKVQKQLAEMPPTYKNKSPEDAKLRDKLEDRENKLAFVIYNTAALLEKAKKECILESVDDNAKWILQEITKNLNLSDNKSIRY